MWSKFTHSFNVLNRYAKGKVLLQALATLVALHFSFSAAAQPNIDRVEYYVDVDPGIGHAASLAIGTGNDLTNLTIPVNTAVLAEGVHRLYVRAKSANGWGLSSTWLFYKPYGGVDGGNLPPAPNISNVEYYIDADPGIGAATPLSISPATNLQDLIIPINPTPLAEGVHRLYVRAKSANGWSLTNTWLFYKPYGGTDGGNVPPTPNISNVEYYIDADPGQGRATALSISPATNLQDLVIPINPTLIADGVHRLYVRAKSANGWSLTDSYLFYKPYGGHGDSLLPVPNIAYIEYYINTDPGYGKGKPVAFTKSKDISNLVVPVDITSLDTGRYTVFFRARNDSGSWSLVNKWDFRVDSVFQRKFSLGDVPAALCAGSVVKVPVKVNKAFGAGNAFTAQLSNSAGSFASPVNIGSLTADSTDTISATIPANAVAGSDYRIRVIASVPRDTTDISTSLTISRIPEQSFSIVGRSTVCTGSEAYSISDTATGTRYKWSLSGGGVLDTSHTTVSVTWTTKGTYSLSVVPYNTCGTGTVQTLVVKVFAGVPSITPVIVAAGRTLTASGTPNAEVLAYQWYKNNSLIAGATGNTYNAVTDGSYTVSYTNTCGAGAASVPFVIVTQQSQTITFDSIPDKVFGSAPFKLIAKASSNLPVVFAVVSGPATVSNDSLFITGVGSVTVRAIQAGNANFDSTDTQRSFTVRKGHASISFSNLTTTYNGSQQSPSVSTTPAKLPVILTFNGSTDMPVNAGSYQVIATINSPYYDGADTATFVILAIPTPDLLVQNVTANKSMLAGGDTVKVAWEDKNIGAAKALIDWTENIYLQSATGDNRTMLTQVAYTKNDSIKTGQVITRSETVVLPAQINTGDSVVFVVELVPGSSIHENADNVANNTGVQQNPLAVKKTLSLALSYFQITEGADALISGVINRTGSLLKALTVQVNSRHSKNLSLPATVIIPAGQAGVSFDILAPDNDTLEGTINDTLTVSAPSYISARAGLSILDNDKPSLSITSLASDATEGQTVTFKVATNLALATPLTVRLASNNQKRFPVPDSIVIPAGALFATVSVNVVQDTVPEIDAAVRIDAGAPGYNPASAMINLKDDDLPGLELVFETNLISEAAGTFATHATLRRKSDASTAAFTATITADSANQLILPSTISLAAGETEKTFNVGVIDNTIVDGERKVVVTASINVASCGCTAPPMSAGSVSAAITISDNDGPALQLTAANLTLPEGLVNAGTIRVIRNTPVTNALVVALSSSDTTEAIVPATITIPAGSDHADVVVTTINDGIADGAQQVYFQAKAKGFSTGSVWVLVTDQNKPDLQIPAVTVSKDSVQANTIFNYTVTIKNTGFATAPTGLVVKGYLSKDDVVDDGDTLISTDITTTPIPAGATVQVLNAVTAPNIPGNYNLLFKVNPELTVTELLTTNNTSNPLKIAIRPPYTATAIVAQPYYLQGATIPITGTAVYTNGTPAANQQVEVYIIADNGVRKELEATTNAAGNYATEYIPLAKEANHYIAGASFPGLNASEEQDSFDILGVKINGGEIPQFKVALGDTLRGTVTIENLSKRSLHNFTFRPVSLPNGAHITFSTVSAIAGSTTANINYQVSGTELSPGRNFEVATLQAIADEGAVQTADFYYYSQAAAAYVVADMTNIDVSVSQSKGEHVVELRLENKGAGATGEIKIKLPQADWLTSVTPTVLNSLATGDTAVVVLKYLAAEDVPFDYPINGSIGVSVQNGNSFNVPFTFKKVAEAKGDVVVTATDQFTYYSAGEPKVKGAHVLIKNYFTGEVYADGYTDTGGVFIAKDVPEGRHRIVVEKDKHLPYESTITINPGDTVATTVFLNYQAITFNWSVVPTAIQDQYTITLTTVFETDVPVPVVTVEMPKSMPQLSGDDVFAFNITLTNHGLITAKDVALNLPNDDREYEFVTNYVPADLLAHQSIQVPVIMRRRTSMVNFSGGHFSMSAISKFLGMKSSQYSAMTEDGGDCQDFVSVVYWYKCNLSTGLWQQGGALFSFEGRICSSTDPGGQQVVEGWPFDGGGYPVCASCPPPTCFDCTGNYTPPEYKDEKSSCVHCITDIASAITGCAGATGPSLALCAFGVWYDKGGALDYVTSCVPGAIPGEIGCLFSILSAINTCAHTQSSRDVKTFAELSSQKASASTTPVLGAAFDEISANLKVVADAYQAREDWGKEYFGDLIYNDGWTDLEPRIERNIIDVDSILPTQQVAILDSMEGYEISQTAIKAFFVRWNTSVYARSIGVLMPNTTFPAIINWKLVKAYSDSMVSATNFAVNKGFTSVYDMYQKEYAALNEIIDQQSHKAVCASVTVQFSQQLTMTREAFEGTLNIFNGHPTDKMDSLSVHIEIKDENGVPSNGLFEIQTTSLTNLSDITGTGSINAQEHGTVKFLFIPEVGAAPTAPKQYSFGGYIRYLDPYAQAIVTLPLSAPTLTVNPSPNLVLHYFMERNILSDDPLTEDIIEPTVPAELAVMVENQGYGPAVNLTISSAQPKIVDNEKGLDINFKLVGSNLQGQPRQLGITNINFGTIPPLQTRIGEWYFTSSLLGKFVSYDANVVHDNSFGNPDLSLIKSVKLHELTRSIRAYAKGEDSINDFLVNDIFDTHDVPDIIYFSQGNRTEKVNEAAAAGFSQPVSAPTFTNILTVSAFDTGWNYVNISDPGFGKYELARVTRSDGQVIPLDNAWLTFVTLPVSRPPVYENKFHFVDSFPSLKPVTYTVTWKPKNLNVPKIVSITGYPAQVTAEQVKKLTVVFDKPIDSSSFTFEDVMLTFQGGADLSDNSIKLKQVSDSSFEVDISKITTGNGFYAFTVQAAGIKDIFGISGTSGKQVTWSQFLTVPAVQAFLGLPEGNKASSFDTVQILFNLAIDSASVTPARFKIFKDSVLLPGTVVIDSIRADKKLFYLSGLGNIMKDDGQYEFVVDLPNIRSTNNIAGAQPQSIFLTIDKTGPVVVSLDKSDSGGLDPQHITSVNIKFNENVTDFNTADIKLTRNGDIIPLKIAQLSNTDLKSWSIDSLGLATYPEGSYELTLNMAGIKDEIGNAGSGTKKIAWSVNRSQVITLSNLKIAPDLGFSGSDNITSGDTMTVSFDLSDSVSQITISQVDLTAEVVLKYAGNVPKGHVSIPVKLITGGNTSIRVRAANPNGPDIVADQGLYIDQLAFTARWDLKDSITLPKQLDTIPLVFSSKLLSTQGFISAVELKHAGIATTVKDLKFYKVNDTTYNVYGIRKESVADGVYEINFDITNFSKYSSGLRGSGLTSAVWIVKKDNHSPVADAGADTTITQAGSYMLDGSKSSDVDGDSIIYSWVSPAGIILSDSTSAKPSFTITSSTGNGTYPFLLVVSDSATFSTDVVNVKVDLLSSVSFSGLSDSYCISSGPATLTGSPAGGVFSGEGITGNQFDPASAGIGQHIITYTKDGKSTSQTTTVNPVITPTFDTIPTVCAGSVPPVLPQQSVNGISGTWNPATISNTASGTYTFTPDAGQCATATTITVSVSPLIAYYLDNDGDGYGDPDSSIQTCKTLAGYVTNNADCNDSDSSIHPGATEVCNGIDDNCNGMIDEDVQVTTLYLDADGDGYGTPDSSIQTCKPLTGYVTNNADCNDSDSAIHPGATEVCNGIDDNCNGMIDEDVQVTTLYLDADGDGYGTPDSSVQTCKPLTGYVTNNADCNDSDSSIHPGAVELCDGKDNNCNGQVDEGVQVITWYRDADSDGYGRADSSIQSCSKPAGYVSNSADCNDNNAAIHPGAVEVCDGIDNNCNGLVDEGCAVLPVIIVQSRAEVIEGNTGTTDMVFSIALNKKSTAPVQVQYRIKDKTATAPSDYVLKTGTITFPPNTNIQLLTVQVVGDTINEKNETFEVDFSNPVNAVLSAQSSEGVILNDDAATALPKLIVYDTTTSESLMQAQVRVSLTSPLKYKLTVLYQTEDGSAKSPADYTAIPAGPNTSVTFAAGETDKYITIPVKWDNITEPRERFFVNLLALRPLTDETRVIGLSGKRRGVIEVTDSPLPVTSNLKSAFNKQEVVADEGLNVTVHPNPSTEEFYLNVDSKTLSPVRIRVTDISGHLIETTYASEPKSKITVGKTLRRGAYFIEVTQGAFRKIIQVQKQ